MSRPICWPDPDATCLEGGCSYCWDSPKVSETLIREYARTAGQVKNRGNSETKSAWEAYWYGFHRSGK